MKICFIVLAHHQPSIFHKLINRLAGFNADIIVHIDKRSDLAKFEITDHPNVHFVEKRYKVHWGGWSLTSTICKCLKYGLEVSDADYFMYLAGTDFPIKHSRHFTGFLARNHPVNFLNYYPLVPGIWGYGLIRNYRLMDLKARFVDVRHDEQESYTSRISKFMASMVNQAENMANRYLLPRDKTWIDFYSGSSRWCLNRDAVQFLVDFIRSKQSRKLRTYLRLATNSDEIFFQTAILNSEHKKHCISFDESAAREIFEGKREAMPDEKRVYLHYIDWNPEREDPAILDESDLPALDNSDKFFACKFTEEKSMGLIDLLEKRLSDESITDSSLS
jgi:hypothetical protein